MERLCERPGCSDPASVAYGMRAAEMVFWLDALRESDDRSHGLLCRRHADSMIVPSNWTLDDLRDPDPRLFRVPAPAPNGPPARRSTRRPPPADQLQLGIGDGAQPALAADPPAAARATDLGGSVPDAPTPDAWMPAFESDDDLDGLLAARSPLLARAFRGADRRRPG